jgi:hypothetical protein
MLMMFRLIRRYPVPSAIVWTAVVLILLASYFVTPTYQAVIFRHI